MYALAATAFALLTGSAPAGMLPAWEGIYPARAEQFEAATELEAEEALVFIARRRESDPVLELFENAPEGRAALEAAGDRG